MIKVAVFITGVLFCFTPGWPLGAVAVVSTFVPGAYE